MVAGRLRVLTVVEAARPGQDKGVVAVLACEYGGGGRSGGQGGEDEQYPRTAPGSGPSGRILATPVVTA